MNEGIKLKWLYKATYRNPDGSFGWQSENSNMVPNEWLNGILNGTLSFGTSLYIFLVDNAGFSAFAAADTMSSHAGWTEFTDYFEGNRQAAALSTSTVQSRTNSGSLATFTFSGSGTLKGAGLSTSLTKGGTGGSLCSESAFSGGNQAVTLGGTLDITVTITAASA